MPVSLCAGEIQTKDCFGATPLQRTRSDGQAFKPARETRALPGQLRRRGIGRVHRNLKFRFRYWRDRFSFAQHALEACSKGSEINQFGYARFQRARLRCKKTQDHSVKSDWPDIKVRNV
jgi:hypothetical protein